MNRDYKEATGATRLKMTMQILIMGFDIIQATSSRLANNVQIAAKLYWAAYNDTYSCSNHCL
jgi:hypothetical protein